MKEEGHGCSASHSLAPGISHYSSQAGDLKTSNVGFYCCCCCVCCCCVSVLLLLCVLLLCVCVVVVVCVCCCCCCCVCCCCCCVCVCCCHCCVCVVAMCVHVGVLLLVCTWPIVDCIIYRLPQYSEKEDLFLLLQLCHITQHKACELDGNCRLQYICTLQDRERSMEASISGLYLFKYICSSLQLIN